MAVSPKERAAATDGLQPDQQPDDTSATEESHTETKNQAEEPRPREASPHEDAVVETEQLENATDKKERGEVSGNDEEDEGEDEEEESEGEEGEEGEDEKPYDGSTKDNGGTDAEAAGGDVAEPPPPLPDEPLPEVQEDDGWDPMWSDEHKSWFFFNRFTKQTQWENPRVPTAGGRAAAAVASGGYNPAIHGDYDPNAWYAKGLSADPDAKGAAADGADGAADDAGGDGDGDADIVAAAASAIISGSGGADADGHGESQFSHDAKARRQMNAYFDMDAAASAHDGRSLKAERSGKKPTRAELKAFKEKRRARKEEKRRAWLRD